jgi:hypothetical protein
VLGYGRWPLSWRCSDHVLLLSGADMQKGPARRSWAFRGCTEVAANGQAACLILMTCLTKSTTLLIAARGGPWRHSVLWPQAGEMQWRQASASDGGSCVVTRSCAYETARCRPPSGLGNCHLVSSEDPYRFGVVELSCCRPPPRLGLFSSAQFVGARCHGSRGHRPARRSQTVRPQREPFGRASSRTGCASHIPDSARVETPLVGFAGQADRTTSTPIAY